GVLRAVDALIKNESLSPKDCVFYCIGRRGGDYFASRGYEVRVRNENVSDLVSADDLRAATDAVLSWHASGEVGRVSVAYTNFLSTSEQKPTVRRVTPLDPESLKAMVQNIPPVKGKFSGLPPAMKEPNVYTIEPNAETVLHVLIPDLAHIAIFHALLEAKA